MKKQITLALFSIVLLLGSCNKITQNKLVGTWTVSSATRNGTDYTALFPLAYPNYKLTFNKNGTFTESYGSTVNTGIWTVESKGKIIKLNPNALFPRVYNIVKIKKKEMEVKTIVDNIYNDDYQLVKTN